MSLNIKHAVAGLANIHRPDGRPNVFIFSTPRSGSTWLMELILTQPGFKPCSEPFNLAVPAVRENLARFGIVDWADFHGPRASVALKAYMGGFFNGRLTFKNPFPHRNYFRFVTRRIIFKILHAGEDRISWFRDTFNGRIVLLLRHPIAVSLSREVCPRLEARLNSDYSRHFTAAQLKAAKTILASGTKLERGVLDWSLQNAVALRSATADWTVISYEQLVLEPEPVIQLLARRLDLPNPERFLRRLGVPSASTYKSDERTRTVLAHSATERANQWLVNKWREKVGEDEERRAMNIVEQFDISVYKFGSGLPAEPLWVRDGS
jgi:hypothetical protein